MRTDLMYRRRVARVTAPETAKTGGQRTCSARRTRLRSRRKTPPGCGRPFADAAAVVQAELAAVAESEQRARRSRHQRPGETPGTQHRARIGASRSEVSVSRGCSRSVASQDVAAQEWNWRLLPHRRIGSNDSLQNNCLRFPCKAVVASQCDLLQ